MTSEIAYTPEQAAELLRDLGINLAGNTIRLQAQDNPAMLGFPVSVASRRVLIPAKSFKAFWGIKD